MVVGLLGDALVRQEGQEVLDLVERSGRAAGRTRPRPPPFWTASTSSSTRLVRAFVAYFQLANVTEQVHRGRALRAARPAAGGWPDTAAAIHDGRRRRAPSWPRWSARMAVRPVFTAHPTEAARRTILGHLRTVADLLDAESGAADRPPPGRGRRAAVAHRRPPGGPAGPSRRGPQRRLLLRRTGPARSSAPSSTTGRQALGGIGLDVASGRGPLTFRSLDRRRPGRQPQRHPGGHPRRAPAASTTTASARPLRVIDGLRRDLADLHPAHASISPELAPIARRPTWPTCRSWKSDTCGSTPRSRTG